LATSPTFRKIPAETVKRGLELLAGGLPIPEIARVCQVSEPTVYGWRKRFLRQESDAVKKFELLKQDHQALIKSFQSILALYLDSERFIEEDHKRKERLEKKAAQSNMEFQFAA
jgi:hypothetical protein